MSKHRAIRALVRCTAWLAIGLVITVAVSWGLAAWMPQKNWREQVIQNAWLDTAAQRGVLSMQRFDAFGSTRRCSIVEIPTSSGHLTTGGLHSAIDQINLPQPARRWRERNDGAFGWPQWGRLALEMERCWTPELLEGPSRIDVWQWHDTQLGGEHATGWPVLALWYSITTYSDGKANVQIPGGLSLMPKTWTPRSGHHLVRALPYRPIWPGLAINSVFWGAAAFAVVHGPRTVRAALRRRRGLCPACAYPVGASPVCTECGAVVTARPQTA